MIQRLPKVDEICSALTVQSPTTVPCHNDLLAENLIDDGDRLWLIDYEYSGNNDPCFELGNIWSEADLTLDQLDELVGHYYGTPSQSLIARARLLGASPVGAAAGERVVDPQRVEGSRCIGDEPAGVAAENRKGAGVNVHGERRH